MMPTLVRKEGQCLFLIDTVRIPCILALVLRLLVLCLPVSPVVAQSINCVARIENLLIFPFRGNFLSGSFQSYFDEDCTVEAHQSYARTYGMAYTSGGQDSVTAICASNISGGSSTTTPEPQLRIQGIISSGSDTSTRKMTYPSASVRMDFVGCTFRRSVCHHRAHKIHRTEDC